MEVNNEPWKEFAFLKLIVEKKTLFTCIPAPYIYAISFHDSWDKIGNQYPNECVQMH